MADGGAGDMSSEWERRYPNLISAQPQGCSETSESVVDDERAKLQSKDCPIFGLTFGESRQTVQCEICKGWFLLSTFGQHHARCLMKKEERERKGEEALIHNGARITSALKRDNHKKRSYNKKKVGRKPKAVAPNRTFKHAVAGDVGSKGFLSQSAINSPTVKVERVDSLKNFPYKIQVPEKAQDGVGNEPLTLGEETDGAPGTEVSHQAVKLSETSQYSLVVPPAGTVTSVAISTPCTTTTSSTLIASSARPYPRDSQKLESLLKDISLPANSPTSPNSPSPICSSVVNNGSFIASGRKSCNGGAKKKGCRLLPLKDRKYDPDSHCGVIIGETGLPCTRSLTCRIHSTRLQREVPDRSKSLKELLADKKTQKGQPAASPQVQSVPAKMGTSEDNSKEMAELSRQEESNRARASLTCKMTNMLASSTSLPCKLTAMPASSTSLPCKLTNMPASSTSLPCKLTAMPASSTSLPCKLTAMPASSTSLPCKLTNMPASSTSLPFKSTNMLPSSTSLVSSQPAKNTGLSLRVPSNKRPAEPYSLLGTFQPQLEAANRTQDLPTLPHHPRPAAMNLFCQRKEGGRTLKAFNQSFVRAQVAKVLAPDSASTGPSPPKKPNMSPSQPSVSATTTSSTGEGLASDRSTGSFSINSPATAAQKGRQLATPRNGFKTVLVDTGAPGEPPTLVLTASPPSTSLKSKPSTVTTAAPIEAAVQLLTAKLSKPTTPATTSVSPTQALNRKLSTTATSAPTSVSPAQVLNRKLSTTATPATTSVSPAQALNRKLSTTATSATTSVSPAQVLNRKLSTTATSAPTSVSPAQVLKRKLSTTATSAPTSGLATPLSVPTTPATTIVSPAQVLNRKLSTTATSAPTSGLAAPLSVPTTSAPTSVSPAQVLKRKLSTTATSAPTSVSPAQVLKRKLSTTATSAPTSGLATPLSVPTTPATTSVSPAQALNRKLSTTATSAPTSVSPAQALNRKLSTTATSATTIVSPAQALNRKLSTTATSAPTGGLAAPLSVSRANSFPVEVASTVAMARGGAVTLSSASTARGSQASPSSSGFLDLPFNHSAGRLANDLTTINPSDMYFCVLDNTTQTADARKSSSSTALAAVPLSQALGVDMSPAPTLLRAPATESTVVLTTVPPEFSGLSIPARAITAVANSNKVGTVGTIGGKRVSATVTSKTIKNACSKTVSGSNTSLAAVGPEAGPVPVQVKFATGNSGSQPKVVSLAPSSKKKLNHADNSSGNSSVVAGQLLSSANRQQWPGSGSHWEIMPGKIMPGKIMPGTSCIGLPLPHPASLLVPGSATTSQSTSTPISTITFTNQSSAPSQSTSTPNSTITFANQSSAPSQSTGTPISTMTFANQSSAPSQSTGTPISTMTFANQSSDPSQSTSTPISTITLANQSSAPSQSTSTPNSTITFANQSSAPSQSTSTPNSTITFANQSSAPSQSTSTPISTITFANQSSAPSQSTSTPNSTITFANQSIAMLGNPAFKPALQTPRPQNASVLTAPNKGPSPGMGMLANGHHPRTANAAATGSQPTIQAVRRTAGDKNVTKNQPAKQAPGPARVPVMPQTAQGPGVMKVMQVSSVRPGTVLTVAAPSALQGLRASTSSTNASARQAAPALIAHPYTLARPHNGKQTTGQPNGLVQSTGVHLVASPAQQQQQQHQQQQQQPSMPQLQQPQSAQTLGQTGSIPAAAVPIQISKPLQATPIMPNAMCGVTTFRIQGGQLHGPMLPSVGPAQQASQSSACIAPQVPRTLLVNSSNSTGEERKSSLEPSSSGYIP